MPPISRRAILLGGAAGLSSAAICRGTATAAEGQIQATAARAFFTTGTTLQQVATKAMATGYSRLVAGPGYPLVVRENLASAQRGRDDRRTGLASIVQFSDMHMIDAQSPMRFEFLNKFENSACRPQEAMGTHGGAQLVKRINDLQRGPFSNRRFDCVVSTGDNTDNQEQIELDWFLSVMSGGEIVQNTGDPRRWEGVQTSGDADFYHPEEDLADRYKTVGFPQLPGYFDQIIAPHTSVGLNTPWYSVFGNHDDSIVGVLPAWWTDLNKWYTGTTKFNGFANASSNAALQQAISTGDTSLRTMSTTAQRSTWTVTADARRIPVTPAQYMQRHLDLKYAGPGPFGHGFSAQNVAENKAYYTFRISPGVTGIALDTTNRGGWTDGSLGEEQFQWLERVLKAKSSTWYDASNVKQTQSVDDELFVVFSHHTSWTMFNYLTDPARPDERRRGGWDVINLLHRFPNVVAWVNGHEHEQKIYAHWNCDPKRSFWQINSASHIDAPQLARIIEICDNHDGTLSLFTTSVESAAPYQAAYSDGSQAAVASRYRELAYNDPGGKPEKFGESIDWNTELLLADPVPNRRITNPTPFLASTPQVATPSGAVVAGPSTTVAPSATARPATTRKKKRRRRQRARARR